MKKRELNRLMKDYDLILKQLIAIAASTDTDSEILEALASLTDEQILTAVDLNPNTPSKLLERRLNLFNGNGPIEIELRKHVLSNPALRLATLKKVSKNDFSQEVRSFALLTLNSRVK